MSYSLSFSPDFFWSEHLDRTKQCQPSDQPTSVEQAIRSLSAKTWTSLARDVFDCESEFLTVETVMRRVIETNTCRNLDPPVEVYVDPECEFSVLVYDRNESGIDKQ